ncbi:hypothetical protein JCM10296v2_006486 [Rhodotorula toruloides]
MLRLSLLPLLSLPLALLLAPLAHAQFSTDTTPACCRTCYASTLTQYDALKPGEAGSLGAWCEDGAFTSAVKRCWDQTCQWDAACSYAVSTSYKSHSSVAAKVATDPGTAVSPLVTSNVAPSASATATAVAQSDTIRQASSSTSGVAKFVCTSLFALIGAVILAVVVFLEAGPSL